MRVAGHDPRQGPEWDDDAVDESGELDDLGETLRDVPPDARGEINQEDDASRAFEDRPESSW